MSGDAAVAVPDVGSDGPAEGQNEAPEKAMEPEARAFDPEVFLSLSGHTSVAGPPGEVNGDGSPGPVAGPEVVAAERNVSEPEVVQGNSGTGGGDFDDAGFGPVDEKSVPLPPADGGGSGGPEADAGDAEELGAVVAGEPVAPEVVAGGGAAGERARHRFGGGGVAIAGAGGRGPRPGPHGLRDFRYRRTVSRDASSSWAIPRIERPALFIS